MANRYWVGGTGNWSNTARWSTTSGGAGGAAVPTSADSVFFNASSFSAGGQSVTLDVDASCLDMNWTGATNTPTLAPSASLKTLSVYGSLTFISAMSVTYSSNLKLVFAATTTGKTIAPGNATNIGNFANRVDFSGVGGAWTLSGAISSSSTAPNIFLLAGTLNTNGHSVTCNSLLISGSLTRAISLGASTITCNASWFIQGDTTANVTVTAGTSTIQAVGSFSSAGFSYNNVVLTGPGAVTVGGSGTYVNLSRTSGAVKTGTLTFDGGTTHTITGTLTLTGNSVTNRLFVTANTLGDISVSAAVVTASNVDFHGVNASGAASWNLSAITGGSGNCGSNTGITFTSPTTRYWKAAGGALLWSSTANWSATSGGTTGASVPLCHDTVVFDANSITSGVPSITADMLRIGGDISLLAVSSALTLDISSVSNIICGYLELNANVTLVPGGLEFYLISSSYLYSSGRTFSTVGVRGGVSTLTLGDSLTLTGGFSVLSGDFSTNSHPLTVGTLTSSGLLTRSVILGSSLVTITGTGAVINFSVATNLTLTPGTSTIKLTNVSATLKTLILSNLVFNNLWIATGSTGIVNFNSTGTFNDLKCDSPGQVVRFAAGTTTYVNTFDFQGTSGNEITVTSSTAAVHNLVKEGGGTSVSNYLNISQSNASPADTWYAGASTDGGSNTGWIFSAPAATDSPLFFGDIL